MTRKQHLNDLKEDGYQAALAGAPCEAPTMRESERAAWEIGWRAARRQTERERVTANQRANGLKAILSQCGFTEAK
jgi:ribosome modulation factor